MIEAGTAASLLNGTRSQATQQTMSLGTLATVGRKPMSAATADKVAKDFESMFVAQMLEQMFGESLGSDLFGDAETDEVYKGLMMEEYGKQITKSGGIGIADYVKRELLKLQEVE